MCPPFFVSYNRDNYVPAILGYPDINKILALVRATLLETQSLSRGSMVDRTTLKIKDMSDYKAIYMPDGGGCDSNALAAMCGNQWTNNPLWLLIILALGGRGFLGGGCGDGYQQQLNAIQNTLNSQQTNNLIMDAIKGNACAIGNLATQLGCSADQLAAAIAAVNNNITAQGYQNQLANCQQTNAINSNFAQTNYNMATQCCDLKQSGRDNTAAILAKLDAIEDSRKDREIAALTAANATLQARAERQAEMAPVYAALKDIQAKQPSTATVPYPNLIGIPAAQYYGYGRDGGLWN